MHVWPILKTGGAMNLQNLKNSKYTDYQYSFRCFFFSYMINMGKTSEEYIKKDLPN